MDRKNNIKIGRGVSLVLTILLMVFAPPVFAQDEAPTYTQEELDEYQAWAEEFVASLRPKTGNISLRQAKVTLTVPETYYFLDAKNARAVLEDAWGNPPDEDILGMIFPANAGPLDEEAWGVTIYWSADGYVSDEDASEIDYDELMQTMQVEMRDANAYREENGYPPVDLVGWAEPPVYDEKNHHMYWAKDMIFGDEEMHTLNYDMRVLGRRGVLTLSFIASMDQLENVRNARADILQMAQFNSGNRYADYKEGDKKAEYGLAALVAGGAGFAMASKTGLFTALLIALKKFGIFIFAGIAALFSRIKNMFGGGSNR